MTPDEPPPPLAYRNAAADPRPVLPYGRPERRLPGDQMAVGFGCLASVLLPILMAAAVTVADAVSRGLGLANAWWPDALAVAGVVLAHVGFGVALGKGMGRWGYLRGIGWSAVIAAGVFVLLRTVFR